MILENNKFKVELTDDATFVHINLPVRYDFRRATSLDDCRKMISNTVRLDLLTTLEAVKTIGTALIEGEVENMKVGEQLIFLSNTSAAYAETLESLEMTFENWQDEITAEQVLEFAGKLDSDQPDNLTLAAEVSGFLETHTSDEAHELLETLDAMRDNDSEFNEYTRELVKRFVCLPQNKTYLPQLQQLINKEKN